MEIREVSPANYKTTPISSKLQLISRTLFVIYSIYILLAAFINWEAVSASLESTFGLTTSNSFLLFMTHQIYLTHQITYPGILKLALIFFVLLSLWAGLSLSRGRNVLESVALYFAYVIPKPKSLWGKIYNRTSRNEVPFATVRIISEDIQTGERKFETEAISDLFGRYRVSFNTLEGRRYYLSCRSENYNYLEIDLDTTAQEHISIFRDLELTPIVSNAGVFTELINKILFPSVSLTVKYLYAVGILSLIFTFIALVKVVSIGTVAYFLLMLISFLWNTYVVLDLRNRKIGKLLYQMDNQPAQDINLSIGKKGNRISSSKTNKDGVVNFSADPGVYELSLLGSNNCEFIDNKSYIEVEINKKGFSQNDVFLKKTLEDSKSNMSNPFS